jgi:hypothetical protein
VVAQHIPHTHSALLLAYSNKNRRGRVVQRCAYCRSLCQSSAFCESCCSAELRVNLCQYNMLSSRGHFWCSSKKKKTPVGWGYKMWCSFRSSAAIHAPLVHSNLCMSQQYSEDLLILFRCIHTRLVHTIQRHTRTQIWKRLRFRCVCVCVCVRVQITIRCELEHASGKLKE